MSEKKEKVYYERGTNELGAKSMRAQRLVKAFNDCDPENGQEKERLIRELFGSVSEGISIE
jgi:maltose O-acetyltransferase